MTCALKAPQYKEVFLKKQPAKRLMIRKETLSDLHAVTGGYIIGYDRFTTPIDDTVYRGPRISVGCTVGCPVRT